MARGHAGIYAAVRTPARKDNPVADALSRGTTETKKTFTHEPILDYFNGKNHEKPRAKTNALANPVILQKGQDTRKCTTTDCEALSRGNIKGLCQGCWATAYEKRRNVLLAPGAPWEKAAEEVREAAAPDRKRKNAGRIEMRGKRVANPERTSLRC